MNRNCIKLELDSFIDNVTNYPLYNSIELYVDLEIENEIVEMLGNINFVKKFRRIVHEILNNRYNEDLYGKENVSEKAKDVTAMKFKSIGNLRIYCKEFFITNKKIVAIQLINKKSQKNHKKIKSLLETIGGYEYEFDK